MKLHLHHIEICTQNPERTVKILQDQFRFGIIAIRETLLCSQTVLQSGQTIFIVTYAKLCHVPLPISEFIHGEPWTNFCCNKGSICNGKTHKDSVFNIALRVENLSQTLDSLSKVNCEVIQKPVQVGGVKYAIVTSPCGNVVHTFIEKPIGEFELFDWSLPGFTRINVDSLEESTTHLDHVAFVCREGEINGIIQWYEDAFEMKRFITNRSEDESDGLVIDGDVGLRLKVMEFWVCSEIGLSSTHSDDKTWNVFKLVVGESLPHIKNTQIQNFLRDHNGPGLQHIGLHSSNIMKTVETMFANGVKFRQPPPTYYTAVGQLEIINLVGEDVKLLSKYGILLDNEADSFDDETMDISNHNQNEFRYLMQIFTHPIFEMETFFFEIIQRKGARGFGIGNVTALSRSINAYEKQIRKIDA